MQQFIDNLKPNNKYTLVYFGDFGFLDCQHVIITNVIIRPFAQHKEAVCIDYISKGKHKEQRKFILPHNSVAIFKGYVLPNTEMYVNGADKSLSCFNREYLRIAIDSVKEKPVIVYGMRD